MHELGSLILMASLVTAVFSAGTDLAAGPGRPTERGGEYGLIRRRRTKPLIAAVEGVAFGGGFELAMSADMVVAASNAPSRTRELHEEASEWAGGFWTCPSTRTTLPVNGRTPASSVASAPLGL